MLFMHLYVLFILFNLKTFIDLRYLKGRWHHKLKLKFFSQLNHLGTFLTYLSYFYQFSMSWLKYILAHTFFVCCCFIIYVKIFICCFHYFVIKK